MPTLPAGITATSAPAVALSASGVLDLFVRGTDSATYHVTQSASGSAAFGTWSSIGGFSNGAPSVAHESDGRLAVFVVGRTKAYE